MRISDWSSDVCSSDLDVDGAVLVVAEEGAVRRRRLGELVDLLAQRRYVVARLAEGVGELLVLGNGLGQMALGLEQTLLQGSHALRCVLDATAERDDLLLQRAGVLLQLGQLGHCRRTAVGLGGEYGTASGGE